MKITIIYDNETVKEELKADWGFSCLVETKGTKLLFDTGASGTIVLRNMRKLGIDPKIIESVFISHDHWDHTGGLDELLKVKAGLKVYNPDFSRGTLEFEDGLITTGALSGGVIIEQSLILRHGEGVVVVVGCSHPGLTRIMKTASAYGKIISVIGGFHGFQRYDTLKNIPLIVPCHCTKHRMEIFELFPKTTRSGGAGTIIEMGRNEIV